MLGRSSLWVALLSVMMLASSCAWIARASVDSNGVQANGRSYLRHHSRSTPGFNLSTDAGYIAFVSTASNLVVGDTNGVPDVFVRNNVTGGIERADTEPTAYGVVDAVLSDDGRHLAYTTVDHGVDSAGQPTTCPGPNIFVWACEFTLYYRNLDGPTEVFVSAATGRSPGILAIEVGGISADGRYIAFSDSSGGFVHDTITATTTEVPTDFSIGELTMSTDGRYVAYEAFAPGQGNPQGIFVHDTATGTTTQVTSEATSGGPSISADGRFVAFSSHASNLVPGDTNGWEDVFVHDTTTGTTTLVSVGNNGQQGNFNSDLPSISADGTRVAFRSGANNWVLSGLPWLSQRIWVRDIAAGTTVLISADSVGNPGNGNNNDEPSISADGRYVAFSTDATNLVSGDTNGVADIIVRAVDTPSIDTVTPDTLDPGTTSSVTVTGSGFGPGTSVATFVTSPNGVTVDTIDIVSDTQLDLTVTVEPGAAPGPRSLYLQVPGPGPGEGDMTASLANCADCLTISP